MKVWKHIIGPGTVWHVDRSTGLPRKLSVGPDDVRHWHDQGKAMLSSGLSIPVPLEHQLDLKAMTAQERAAAELRNNAGWVEDYQVLDNRKGQPQLFGLLDVQDEDTYRKLPTTIKYTSPWINSFTDGNGRRWDGVISHLALTTRPRLTDQKPFGSADDRVSAALSLAPAEPALVMPLSTTPEGLILSRAGLLTDDGLPADSAAFSMMLAEGDVPMKADSPKPKVPPKEGEHKDASPPDDGLPMPSGAPEKQKDMSLIDVGKEMMEALFDVHLPEDTDEKNLAQNLLRSLLDCLKGQHAGIGEEPMAPQKKPPGAADPNAGGSTPPVPAPVVQEAPSMYMSLEEINQVPDPAVRRALQMAHSLQKASVDRYRSDRSSRVERLSRKLTPQGRDLLLSHLKAQDEGRSAQLSLGDDGKVHDPLDALLDMLEHVPGLPDLLTSPAERFKVQDHPKEHSGLDTITPDRAKQVADELSMGLPAVPPPQSGPGASAA